MKQTTNALGSVKLLFLSALIIFMVTVVIGILNGTDLVTFARSTLTTHVHAGTLGFITLCVFGAAIWLFCANDTVRSALLSHIRWLSILAIGSIFFYNVAFFSGIKGLIPVFGSLVFLSIVGFFILVVIQSRKFSLTIPHVLILAAIINLTIGSVIGVLLGLSAAIGTDLLPEGGFVGHTSAMVVGYLVLVGMAVTEWRLADNQTLASSSRWGMAQVLLPFIGGIALVIGAIGDILPLIMLNLPFEIIAVIIFLRRNGRKIGGALTSGLGNARFFGLSAIFLVINIAILVYLIVTYADNFEAAPMGLILAMDHVMFIGVMTNALFGLIGELSRENQGLYPIAEHILYWGMNIGLIGFAVGLLADVTILKVVFTPIMGAGIIVGAVVFWMRLKKTATA